MNDPDRSPQLRGVLAAVIAVILFSGVLALVLDGDEGVPASGARVQVDGVVLVVHADGSSSPLEDGDVVLGGEEVRVQSGSVVIELASGAVLEGREGAGEVASTRVRIGESPELVAGDLLMRGGTPVTVGAGGNDVAFSPPGGDTDGAARIRRGLSVTVGAYRGAAELDSAGQERTVPALRQLSVASLGRPPAAPDPIRLNSTDSWDLRYLGVAFELTRRLDALSQAYSSNFGAAGASAQAIATVLPEAADEPAFGPALIADDDGGGGNRPGGETLVGVAIALLGRGGEFEDRFREVRAFRDDGAEWGLVALDQGVAEGVLVDLVESAFGQGIEPAEVAAPAAGPAAATPSAPTSVPTAAGGGAGNETSGSTPPLSTPNTPSAPTPTVPPTVPPPPTLPPELTIPPILPPPPDGQGVLPDTGVPLLDSIVQPVDDLLGGILGG